MRTRRIILSVLAGTLAPPFVALQALQLVNLTDAQYWLSMATLTITSFAAAASALLSSLVGGSITINKIDDIHKENPEP